MTIKQRIIKYAALAPFMLAVACSGPKVIPDNTLSDIFKDMYLVNAYAGEYGNGLNLDSINIYEPILNDYGYTTRDFTHTLANFTKRKSAKIAPVIEEANNKLGWMLADAEKKIAKENTIDSIARESTKETVYWAEYIHVKEIADTGKLTIIMPAREGRYEISHATLQDSTDMNSGLTNRYYIRDAKGSLMATRLDHVTRGRRSANFKAVLDGGPGADKLEILLAGYPVNLKKPNFRVDSLEIIWYPAIEEARRLYPQKWLYKGIPTDTMEYDWFNKKYKEDSIPFRILPPDLPAEADSLFVGGRDDTGDLPVRESGRDSLRGILQRTSGSGAD